MNRSRILRIVVIVIGFYLIFTTVRAFGDFWSAGDKLIERQKRLANLQKQQQELIKRKEQVGSEAYVELVARNELGLARAGEKIIIVPDELLLPPLEVSPPMVPNWQKWRDLFF